MSLCLRSQSSSLFSQHHDLNSSDVQPPLGEFLGFPSPLFQSILYSYLWLSRAFIIKEIPNNGAICMTRENSFPRATKKGEKEERREIQEDIRASCLTKKVPFLCQTLPYLRFLLPALSIFHTMVPQSRVPYSFSYHFQAFGIPLSLTHFVVRDTT